MIGKLTGVVDDSGEDWVIVDVGGVGYVVACSARTLRRLPPRGAAVALVVETHLREDALRLYGFLEVAERDWFRVLQTVQGVGAKVALAILDIMAPGQIAQAIAVQDRTAFARAAGVGPKLAARLVNELKDKAPAGIGAVTLAAPPDGSVAAQAVSALVNLGYRPAEASGAVGAAARRLGDGAALAELIRSGLKELAR